MSIIIQIPVEDLPENAKREVSVVVRPVKSWEEWRIKVPVDATDEWIKENIFRCEFVELEDSGPESIELEEILED